MIFQNIFANLIGQFLYPILSIILVPFYLHYLGLEGFGLIGFFSTLIALLGVFTKGIGAALQREVARRNDHDIERQTLRRFIRTFEIIYWSIGGLLAMLLVALSNTIAHKWLNIETISFQTVSICLISISLTIALAFPNSIYQTVFIGLQRQVLGNAIQIALTLFGTALNITVIYFWKSISIFYIAGTFNALLSVVLLRYFAGKTLPPPDNRIPVHFDFEEVKKMWRFTIALIWVNGIGLVITRLDRIIISKLLSLSTLGIYTAGVAGGQLLGMFYSPFLTAVYPQTCQLAKKHSIKELSSHLIRNSEAILIICMTFGLPISFFSTEILQLWTRNAAIVKGASLIMALYVYGNIFLSLSSVFYQGQMALGITKYGVLFNSLALFWYPLTMWILIKHFGLIGAAAAWVLYCGMGFMYHFIITLRFALRGVLLGKYIMMILKVAAISILLAYLCKYIASNYFSNSILLRVSMGGVEAILTFICCYLTCFGWHIPKELIEIKSKLFSLWNDHIAFF